MMPRPSPVNAHIPWMFTPASPVAPPSVASCPGSSFSTTVRSVGTTGGYRFCRENPRMSQVLYLDQNYLSGFAKRKPAFSELEPAVRAAVAAGAIVIVESDVHAV